MEKIRKIIFDLQTAIDRNTSKYIIGLLVLSVLGIIL